jgi:hypothetical protein
VVDGVAVVGGGVAVEVALSTTAMATATIAATSTAATAIVMTPVRRRAFLRGLNDRSSPGGGVHRNDGTCTVGLIVGVTRVVEADGRPARATVSAPEIAPDDRRSALAISSAVA